MKFVSYAQNFEDVLLWRALTKVERGFYIDVGAAEPFADSVTAAFYKRGWRGINIEPMSGPYRRLVEARPEDINLNIAVENKRTAARYFSVDGGNGISTGVKSLANTYRDANWDVSEITVNVTPLRDVCEKYVGDRPVHFLKVDVEGNEREVLASADFKRFRPWIIVVEATVPNSPTPSHQDWEALLLDAAYRFVYFDGLNRFYLAEEKYDDLITAFSAPPNWFDGFIRASEEVACNRAENLEIEVARLRNELQETQRAWLMEKEGREQGEKLLEETRKGWLMEKSARQDLETRLMERRDEDCTGACATSATPTNEGTRQEIETRVGHQAEISDLRSQIEEREKRVAALETECDACYQELFESSRHTAWLSQEKIRLQCRTGELERLVSDFASKNQQLTDDLERLASDFASKNQQLTDDHERLASNYRSQKEELSVALSAETQKLADALGAVYASTSWRLTKPLRSVKLALRWRP
ncbi:Methyltransferase FkbM [Paraburkholderia sacchari]|uniref:FkbM family methyltransferase n=1 Tax=Paraburkholderia sacchari TaxID=159450 RepID=UPI0039A459A1